MMIKVFISYAHSDAQKGKQIARELKKANLELWIDDRNLHAGDLWTTEIANAISTCNVFLLLMSAASMKSDNVRREVQLAYEKKKKIVILRLGKTRIPPWMQFQLAGIQWISTNDKQWKARLLQAVVNDPAARGKTILPSPASGEIGVLLVDDNPLAREGWKRVLATSKQIKVIGDTACKELLKRVADFPSPETVIAGSSFVDAGLLRSYVLKKAWGGYPRVIVLAANQEQVKAAFKAGADWSAQMPFESQDLITWVRALSDDAKRLCSEYRDLFSTLNEATAQTGKYYDLVSGTLQLLFHPDLVNPEYARAPLNTSPSKRLVFRNQAREHKFWVDTLALHGSKYITADIYNAPLKPSHLETLAGYLSDSHGRFGLVIGRSIPKGKVHSMGIELYENEKKVILPLDDSRLQAMLEYKAGGVNPVFELEELYQQLIADAWK